MYKDFFESTSDEDKNNIKNLKRKKIILVLSDWDQNIDEYEKKLRDNIKNFRNDWVLVYWIGITNDASSIVDLFDSNDKKLGFWKVCENSSDLAKTLKDLLLEHIQDV